MAGNDIVQSLARGLDVLDLISGSSGFSMEMVSKI